MALLAFNRIVVTHPFLVAQQEDVIMECIDSEDITIRIKALDLVQGMVSSENLVSIVGRLMRQLKTSSSSLSRQQNGIQGSDIEPDSGDDAPEEASRSKQDSAPPLPEDYTIDVIGRILKMCSQNNYASVVDFDWYIDVLTQLVRIAPVPRREIDSDSSTSTSKPLGATDISERIGNELRNVAVKVKAVRLPVVRAAELIISRLAVESSSHPIISGALKPVAWIAGEYGFQLSSPSDTLGLMLQILPRVKYPEVVATCLQSIMKLFALVAGDDQAYWTAERKSTISLLMARVIHVLEPLALHPYLEVQERAVEFTELLKLTAEAASGQAPSTDLIQQDAPLLLTQAIPSLFNGWELNSVAVGAQHNVPMPEDLDLDEPIHPNLGSLLAQADSLMLPVQGDEDDEFAAYYNQKIPVTSISGSEPAINRLTDPAQESASGGSYQGQATEESYLDADIVARRKAERLERNRDDPFYIHESGKRSSGGTGSSTPIHNILQNENGPDLDIDSIPIMKLDLADLSAGIGRSSSASGDRRPARPKASPRQRIVVAADETLGGATTGTRSGLSTPPGGRLNYESENNSDSFTKSRAKKLKQQSLLQVDSSNLGSLSLDAAAAVDEGLSREKQLQEEAEMAQAMKEVQRLRLEMQRANERIQVAQGVPAEGIVVQKKKKKSTSTTKTKAKKSSAAPEEGEAVTGGGDGAEAVAVKVKKKKKKVEGETAAAEGGAEAVKKAVKKKKPKRIIQLDDDAADGEAAASG